MRDRLRRDLRLSIIDRAATGERPEIPPHRGSASRCIATAAIAEFGAVILLSFFFSHERPGAGTELRAT